MSEREWRFYIDDMIRFAGNVLSYTEGMDQDDFVSTPLNYDARLRNLELIGMPRRMFRMTFARRIPIFRGG